MNASLANGNGNGIASPGPLRERDPSRLHITRRQIAFALVLAVGAAIAAIYTVSTVTAGQEAYAATVTTSKVYDLNFASPGEVTALLVKVGQRVKAGQVIARQDASTMQSQVAADQAVVIADQHAVTQAQAPDVTPAQRQEDTLQVQQAQTALSNAQADLSAAESAGKANVAGAEAAVTAAQQLVNADQVRYQQSCPNGLVPPATNLTGAQLQTAEAALTQCQSLNFNANKDQATLAGAQAQVPIAQAQAQQAINQAQATVNSAQAALNTAQYQVTLQGSPTDPTAVAQAQANLASAQGQLAQAELSLQELTLISPGSGTVAEVYGAVGEYLGPDGVHQYAAPQAVQSNQRSGIQLFPEQTTPSNNGSTSGSVEPLVEVIGGNQQVMAQVPESHVSGFPIGHAASVSIPALNTTTPARVTEVVLNATRSSTGSVSYDVVLTLDHPVPGLLPGMSATVRS